MKKHKRYPNQIKDDKRKEYDEMETSHADMSDFRRPAYSVRHPKDEYDTQNMSIPQQSVAGYPKDEYGDTQNMSTGQQNVAPYIKSEYGTSRPSAAALIRAQGEQIRRMSAEEYLIDKIGSDADERIQPSGIPGTCSRSRGAGCTGL